MDYFYELAHNYERYSCCNTHIKLFLASLCCGIFYRFVFTFDFFTQTTPLMLACQHDCLLDDEIFDLLTNDMPQSYFERLIVRSMSYQLSLSSIEETHIYDSALRTVIKSSSEEKAKIIIKLVSILSIDHIYKVFEFGTYLMDFVLNYDDFAGVQEFVKACPVDTINEWLLATDQCGDNILHVIAKLKSKNSYTILNELLTVIPSCALRIKNKKGRTPIMEFLMTGVRGTGCLPTKMFVQLNDGQKIAWMTEAYSANQRSEKFIQKSLPILVKQQMCYSLWIMDQIIYSDVIKHDDETTYASNINLTDEDMLDILPWTSVLFKYGPIVDDILTEDDDQKEEEPPSHIFDFNDDWLLDEIF
eukprot:TRINITY_DN1771_c0_g1_i3.p1 TRINITY_DN1771_c0_g1~~TRINITY_DN1771_c0_g1_i3.p1  ORF type:complete len:360 (-),score=41.41 TRINITY_DN1771_c0_g1_i3:32-1111(-)